MCIILDWKIFLNQEVEESTNWQILLHLFFLSFFHILVSVRDGIYFFFWRFSYIFSTGVLKFPLSFRERSNITFGEVHSYTLCHVYLHSPSTVEHKTCNCQTNDSCRCWGCKSPTLLRNYRELIKAWFVCTAIISVSSDSETV